jgi:Uma2 family endonuclease
MSHHTTVLTEENLAFREEDLLRLPGTFPSCVIRDGRIARVDGLPLEWEDYELLDEDFPATLTETGELEMSPRPKPAHENRRDNLEEVLKCHVKCHPGGKVISGPEVRIPGRRRPLAPDLMFFRDPDPRWNNAELDENAPAKIEQIPDLAVEIISPSNRDQKWEEKLAFYRLGMISEVWFVQRDGSVDIWRGSPHMIITVQPGELFSSALFPGLAIDPAWIRKYPEEELSLIRKFIPRIRVLDDPEDLELTKRARQLAARITRHLKLVAREDRVPSSEEFLSQLRQSAEDEPGDLPSQSHGLKP